MRRVVTKIGIRLARPSILAESYNLQSSWKHAEVSKKVNISICLNRCAENQIFPRRSVFSNVHIHRFLYWSIEFCLMFTTSF